MTVTRTLTKGLHLPAQSNSSLQSVMNCPHHILDTRLTHSCLCLHSGRGDLQNKIKLNQKLITFQIFLNIMMVKLVVTSNVLHLDSTVWYLVIVLCTSH